MTAALGEALRLLGLPVDRTVDAPMLNSAYRDAARNAHPDAAAPEERDAQTERMRAVNLARDLVRTHLPSLGAEPYSAFAPGDDGPPIDDWMSQAAMDADGLGVRWNPNAKPVSWAVRFDAARRALAIAVGDGVIVAEDGNILLGRVKAFDQSVRVGLRTVVSGLPVEVRRVGVEIEFEDGDVRTVDAADVEASAWRCPVCLRTSVHGEAEAAAVPALPAPRAGGLPALARPRGRTQAPAPAARAARRRAGRVLAAALAPLPRDRGCRGSRAGACRVARGDPRGARRRDRRGEGGRRARRRCASSGHAPRRARPSATPSARSTQPTRARPRRRSA